MKVRRSTGEFHSSACCGYSRSTNSLNSGVSANSSRLRQKFLPCWPASTRSRISAKLFLLSLLGIRISFNLPMARRATGQYAGWLDIVLFLEIQTLSQGFIGGVLGRPTHIENFILRPDKPFRIAMARDTPLHLQRGSLVG